VGYDVGCKFKVMGLWIQGLGSWIQSLWCRRVDIGYRV
jgi:hypothetical protein